MAISLHVLYPGGNGSRFDYDYYFSTHAPLVEKHFGPHLRQTILARTTASAPADPPAYHLIATFVFADQAAFDAAMAVAEPVLADIPRFTDTTPQMQIGETA
jgi:uncharacterized protein (TIGR02118 family)